ncbi:MAG: hypothetical protein ACK47B_28755 [Armatimonadota bacterium]
MAVDPTLALAEAAAWLEFAGSHYPDGRIPPLDGGIWLKEISNATGCPSQHVLALATEMGVWTSTPHDVDVARREQRQPLSDTAEEPAVVDDEASE